MALTGKTIAQLTKYTSPLTGNELFPLEYNGTTYHVSQSQFSLNSFQITTGSVTASVNASSNIFNIVSGSNTLFVVNNTGSVGIGTTSPAYKLDVNGTARVSGETRFTLPSVTNNTTHNISSFISGIGLNGVIIQNYVNENGITAEGIITTTGPINLKLGTPSFPAALYINNNGRVSIGSTAANERFQVNGGWAYFAGNLDGISPSASSVAGLLAGWNRSGGNGETNIVYTIGAGSNPRLAFGSWNGTSYAEEMNLFAGGLVIGSSAYAGYKLDVNGTARVSGNTTITGNLTLSNSNPLSLTNASAYFSIGSYFFGASSSIIGANASSSDWAVRIGSGGLLIANGTNNNHLLKEGLALFTDNAANTNITGSTSAVLQANSTTKGFLPPRMTTTQRNAISSPATGLTIYNTTTLAPNTYNGTAWVGAVADNIYTADGTLTGNRTVTSGGYNLTFTGSNTASGALATGIGMTHTLVASANDDYLVGLDISNTYTLGAFTNVRSYNLRASTALLSGFIIGYNGLLLESNSNSITKNVATDIYFANPSTGGGAALLAGTIFSPISRVMVRGNGDIILAPGTGVVVGGFTTYTSAILAIDSTIKGFLPPRMTNAQRTAISTPAVGLMVYCTDATEGLYVYKSTGWTFIA